MTMRNHASSSANTTAGGAVTMGVNIACVRVFAPRNTPQHKLLRLARIRLQAGA